MKDGYLCVGGPHDGKLFASSRPSGFSVPVLTETSAASPAGADVRADDESQKVPAHKVVDYRLETFGTPQGDVKMWTPTNQTPMQTMTLLLESYAQGAKYWRNMGGR